MKKKYFGTDGIRAKANSSKLNGNTLMLLGMALGNFFTDGNHRHRVVIGKDTRLSGYMIEQAITSGLLYIAIFCSPKITIFPAKECIAIILSCPHTDFKSI